MSEPEAQAEGPDEVRYREEGRRLLAVLHSVAKSKGMSIRTLEKSVGIGDSVFAKVLSGKVTPQLRHLLMMCDGLGLEWREFFRLAYPLDPAEQDERDRKRIFGYLVEFGLLDANGRKTPPLPSGDQ